MNPERKADHWSLSKQERQDIDADSLDDDVVASLVLHKTSAGRITEQNVAGPAPPMLEEIDEAEGLMPHEHTLDRICEQILDISVPQVAEQLIREHGECCCCASSSGFGRDC